MVKNDDRNDDTVHQLHMGSTLNEASMGWRRTTASPIPIVFVYSNASTAMMVMMINDSLTSRLWVIHVEIKFIVR